MCASSKEASLKPSQLNVYELTEIKLKVNWDLIMI
jgi:hypothetical protein